MYQIPVAFHFHVGFDGIDSDNDNRFQEVTGLGAEVTTEELREGGLNEYAHQLPTGAKHGNLTLKRGMLNDSDLADGCRRAVENFVFEPRDVYVTLLSEEHLPVAQWTFTGAWPVKWSVSDFKGQDNALVVETLELAYRRFRKSFPG